MLRNATAQGAQSVHPILSHSFHPINPPKSPTIAAPAHIETDIMFKSPNDAALRVAQLNCFNSKTVTLSILANEDFTILILQEPWIDPHTLRLPPHPAWHEFTPYDYTEKTYHEKPRTGIYITKRISSWLIKALPSKSALLTAVEVKMYGGGLSDIRVIAAYNPPTHNTGLPVLKDWLGTHNNQRMATIIGIDGNLHHPNWNPSGYRHSHPLAKELIRICGSAGFKLSSQTHVPTFYPRSKRARPTTIDLTWVNFELTKHQVRSMTSSENYGSDHQLLTTVIQLTEPLPEEKHNNARFETMAKASFCEDLENQLSAFPTSIESHDDIDSGVDFLTDAIMGAFRRQGKEVKSNTHRHKAWWDAGKLDPIIKERNRARKWMILSGCHAAKLCYWSWNDHVRATINELKREYWRVFLAKSKGSLSYKAFRYTQTQTTNAVAPLYRQDKTLATDKGEQAKLLFQGTSIVNNTCDTSDIMPTLPPPTQYNHPPVTEHEIEEILRKLPS